MAKKNDDDHLGAKGLLDQEWLNAGSSGIVPKQNLDITPDLAALWDHEDRDPSFYALPNKADVPRTMLDLGPKGVGSTAILRVARMAAMQSSDPGRIRQALLSRFSKEEILAAKDGLREVMAERGLLGHLYIDSNDFPKCDTQSKQAAQFTDRYASRARFVIAKGKCNGCMHNQGGFCAVFRKELVTSIPYTVELAEEIEAERPGKKVVASKSPKERIRDAYLEIDIKPQGVTVVQRDTPRWKPEEKFDPIQVPEDLSMALAHAHRWVAWLHEQRRLTPAQVSQVSEFLTQADSKDEIVSILLELEDSKPLEDAEYQGQVIKDRPQWKPKEKFNPVKLQVDLGYERTQVMTLLDWCYRQKMLQADDVQRLALEVALCQSKEELASLVERLEGLEALSEAVYQGTAPQPRPKVTRESILKGIKDAANLLKKRNQEAELAVNEAKARPIVKYLKAEILKGNGPDAIHEGLSRLFDPRNLVATRPFWYPIYQKMGLLGTLYTEQVLFSNCNHGAKFLAKSPVKYVLKGKKCEGCAYNKQGFCTIYQRPLIDSVSEILTPETVKEKIDNLVAAGKAFPHELDGYLEQDPKEALKALFEVEHRTEGGVALDRPVIETEFSGFEPEYATSSRRIEEVVLTTRKYLNEGLYGRDLGTALKRTFDIRDIKAAKDALRPYLSEQGLQGIYWIDPTIYPDYGKGCNEAEKLFRSNSVKYLKIGPACHGCIYQAKPGWCSKINKALVEEPPYEDKAAQQREILESGSVLRVDPKTLINYGANMLEEYELQQATLQVDDDDL